MPHTDSPEIFGPVILSLSILTSCLITFTHIQDSSNQSIILLSKKHLIISLIFKIIKIININNINIFIYIYRT